MSVINAVRLLHYWNTIYQLRSYFIQTWESCLYCLQESQAAEMILRCSEVTFDMEILIGQRILRAICILLTSLLELFLIPHWIAG